MPLGPFLVNPAPLARDARPRAAALAPRWL